MEWFWTWGGRSFEYRNEDELRTRDGRHVGRFHGDEIYAPSGLYLGEAIEDRLIIRISKLGRRKSSFTPRSKRSGRVGRVNRVARVMRSGYRDFPSDL